MIRPTLAVALAAMALLCCAATAGAAVPSLTGPTDLGTAYVHTGGADVTYTATNTSAAPVGRADGSLSSATGLWSDFDGSPSCVTDANGNIPAGGTCTFKLRAVPFGIGAHSGDMFQVTFAPSSTGNPGFSTNTLSLSSTGIAFTLSADVFDFGARPVGLLSPPATITVTRGGGVTIGAASVTGDVDDFLVSSDACAGTTGASSQASTCAIHVRFAPSAQTARSGTLTVASLAPFAETHSASLTGSGTALQGQAGPPGPPGPPGPQGPTGPAGKVVCRNNLVARVLCDQLFAPGTWTVAGASGMAVVTLSRHGVAYARGKARVHGGHIVRVVRLHRLHRVAAGHYRLTLRLHGYRLARTVRIH